jgi:hypothetical protein
MPGSAALASTASTTGPASKTTAAPSSNRAATIRSGTAACWIIW